MVDKEELRKILEKRDNIVLNERIKYDKYILNSLINSPLYNKSKFIFAFVSYKSEVNTHEIIKYALSRFLVKLKRDIPKIALAYGMQIVDYIPMNEWDVKVDGIIVNG